MSQLVHLVLTVGDPAGHPDRVSLTEADTITGLAEAAGVTAIRLADRGDGVLDPTVVAAYLAARHDRIGFIADVPTTHQAPYNTARRVLSLDRATGGRVGLALRAGGGDEVSDASAPAPAAGPESRWSEYARVLTRLWESFPRTALIGDQAAGVVADDSLIRPIDHTGRYYRVAGPLDGPSSRQGRPVLVADVGAADLAAVARLADVLVVDRVDRAGEVPDVLPEWGLVLLGRVEVGPDDPLPAWLGRHRLDGIELVPTGGAAAVTTVLHRVLPHRAPVIASAPPTLRRAYGLGSPAAVPA